jgi:hypothetical protein
MAIGTGVIQYLVHFWRQLGGGVQSMRRIFWWSRFRRPIELNANYDDSYDQ